MCTHAKSLQLCLILCNPVVYSLPDSSVHGILQARMNTGVGSHSGRSRGSSWPSNKTWVSCIAGKFFTDWARISSPPWGPYNLHQEGVSRTDKPTGETVGGGGVARNADTNTDEKAFWLITLNKLRGKNTGFYRNPVGWGKVPHLTDEETKSHTCGGRKALSGQSSWKWRTKALHSSIY